LSGGQINVQQFSGKSERHFSLLTSSDKGTLGRFEGRIFISRGLSTEPQRRQVQLLSARPALPEGGTL
jgi:hypothetical protein